MALSEKTTFQKQIEDLQAQIAYYQSLHDARVPLLGRLSLELRKLAVTIHARACTDPTAHTVVPPATAPVCGWNASGYADDPTNANWSDETHQRYIAIAQDLIATMREIGYTVSEPSTPVPPTPPTP